MTQQSFPRNTNNPIKFGTDGWRGVIADDFTFEQVARVAPVAARVLAETYGDGNPNRPVVVGYDRRFLSEDFAQVVASSLQAHGHTVVLSNTFAPTPALSWAVKEFNALGAIVITASHNPGKYSGLKIKGAFGGSVPTEITHRMEAYLEHPPDSLVHCHGEPISLFNPWTGYCARLTQLVNVTPIRTAIAQGKLTVFADVMHGSAATGLEQLLGIPIHELHSNRDPLFEGNAPEPLPRNLTDLCEQVQTFSKGSNHNLVVGLVFDGDGDRIAAVDSQGQFLSSQVLIPILTEHLATRRGMTGELIKTVSGSDLMPKVAKLYDLPIFETAVGYKYICDRMLTVPVMIGGEESGGIGYGHHIPERDALLSALYLLEVVVEAMEDLGQLYYKLQQKTGFFSAYDRIDISLSSLEVRARLINDLRNHPPDTIAGQRVIGCQTIDGYKFRMEDQRWLMIRFSGTEPLLRLYCEAANSTDVQATLAWAHTWANSR